MGEQNILTLTDFADLASDELTGGYDVVKGERVKIKGYLEDFALSKQEADTLIMSARDKIYKDCKTRKKEYGFEDLFLVTINVDKHYMYTNLKTGDDKRRLEFIEKKLSDPKHLVISKTLNYIGENNSEWHSFNHTSQGINHQHNFKFWN